MTQTTQERLKLLGQSREFDALRELVEEMKINWINQLPTGSSEFEYLKASFERDGKIIGVSALLQEISLIASR